MTNTIQVKHLTVTVGHGQQRKTILNDLNFAVRAGEKMAVLGANGAGKSTLLKCLSGEHSHYRGAIHFAGQDLSAWAAMQRAKQLAVMPQKVELLFPFRVDQVVAIGRAPYGDEQQSLVIQKAAMEAVDIWHLRHRTYPQLSGGEQQRVQLARVLCQIWQPVHNLQGQPQARALLLDECTSALDPNHQHAVMDLVGRFAERGVATLAVMHDISLAAAWADSVLILKGGQTLACGGAELLGDASLLAHAYDMSRSLAARYAQQNHYWRTQAS